MSTRKLLVSAIIACVLGVGIGLNRTGPWAAGRAPRIDIGDRTVDLGRMAPGTSAAGSVRVLHKGGAPLRILKLESTCGCTEVEVDQSSDVKRVYLDLKNKDIALTSRLGRSAGKQFLYCSGEGETEEVTVPLFLFIK